MSSADALHIEPYTRQALPSVARLLLHGGSTHTHLHLDWRTPAAWLADPGVTGSLGCVDEALVSVMAVGPDHEGVAWLRAAAVTGAVSTLPALRRLWPVTANRLRKRGVQTVVALALEDWFARTLEQFGWQPVDSIVTLRYEGALLMRPALPDGLALLPVDEAQLPAVLAVDGLAFAPVWRLHAADLAAAFAQGAWITLAVRDGQPVGYALALTQVNSAHIARIAVDPAWQGRGIGRALTQAALADLGGRGYRAITLNTTASNAPALRLYKQLGFVPGGGDVALWQGDLSG